MFCRFRQVRRGRSDESGIGFDVKREHLMNRRIDRRDNSRNGKGVCSM